MDLIALIVLAIGLSMDSLVIALASGAIVGSHKPVNVLKIAGMLGFIQMALTVFGWSVGSAFAQYIYTFDHWLAFAILFGLGCKVIYDAVKGEHDKKPFNPLDIRVMFSLAVAASIDAAAVGLSLSLVNSPIFEPAIVVGVVTFVIAALGVVFGSKASQRFSFRIHLIGGIILILIGCCILVQHVFLRS